GIDIGIASVLLRYCFGIDMDEFWVRPVAGRGDRPAATPPIAIPIAIQYASADLGGVTALGFSQSREAAGL
ncbi:MAG TPA: hypothetical protein V6D46_07470, partial [Coleofasciculaceae cyanobacterium]